MNNRDKAPRRRAAAARIRTCGKDLPWWSMHHLELAIALALAAATCCAFAPVVGHDFVNYDDQHYVTHNPHVQQGLSWHGVKWAFSSFETGNWIPLTWLSLELDAALFHLRPAGYHATNLILHVANSLLLFGWLRSASGTAWRSAGVAALFALHPLHVESVAWVAERKDVLSGCFWMLTLLAYHYYLRLPSARGYAMVAAAMALGLMAKAMLVTLPFVLLLLDYWPYGRWQKDSAERGTRNAERRGWNTERGTRSGSALGFTSSALRAPRWALLLEKLPLFALSAAACVVTLAAQSQSGSVRSIAEISWVGRAANAVVAYAAYLGRTFWPHRLAVLYPHPCRRRKSCRQGSSWWPHARWYSTRRGSAVTSPSVGSGSWARWFP